MFRAISQNKEKIIREYIDNVLAGNNPDFLMWKNAEESFDKFTIGKSLPSFMFGDFQKSINKMIKRFYIVTYLDPTIRPHFNNYHCPVDNLMIKRE